MHNRLASGFDELRHDLRDGWRALRARPGFTALALATIALGLGASTAILAVVDTVYFRPLPFADGERLVRVREFSVAPDGSRRRVSALGATFELVRDNVQAFELVAAQAPAAYTLEGARGPERVAAVLVSENWGRLLGVRPIAGRHFTPDEERAGEDAGAVLIGHGLWQRQFGARPDVVGATLRLSGRGYTVVGVMPPGFRFPYDAEVWVPARFPPDRSLYVLARLAPGAMLDRANQELAAIGHRIGEIFPNRAGMGVDGTPARANINQGEDRLAVALLGAVGFLLLIACANVAMLMTTNFVARRRDIAVRAALGCGRARQVRQFVAESVLLFLLGGTLGVLITIWLKGWLTSLVPRVLATQLAMADVAIDGSVIVTSFLLALGAGGLAGLLAAARASSADLRGLITEGGRGSTARGRRTLGLLVVTEIALAVTLLASAGLMTSAFQRLQRQDLGFDPQGLLTFRLDLSQGRVEDGGARLDLADRLRERLSTLPGVHAAGAITVNPLCCGDWGARVVIEGQPPASAAETPVIFHRYVTPGLLEAMGVRLLDGRLITDQDTAGSQPVAVVDENLARRFFPGERAVGRRIKRAPYDSPYLWLTIVGVVADVKEEGDYHEGWYLPYAQDATGPSGQNLHAMIRADGDPLALVEPARGAVAAIDRTVAPFDFTTMDRIRSERLQQDRMGTVLVLLFAAFGLLLAGIGVHGLMAFVLGQRTREIGIRLALGANRWTILRQIVAYGLRLAGAGLILGLGGASIAARVLGGLVEDVGSADPLVVPVSMAVLGLVALGACLTTARRALRVDPIEVLRVD